MPSRPTRRAMDLIDEHANTIIFVMLAAMLIVAVFAALGWNKADVAANRVNQIEVERAAEKKAGEIDRVSTCFATARNRPRVVQILEGLAGVVDDRITREALDEQIEEYDDHTPTRTECMALADELGVDPKPYDRPLDGAP